MPVIPQQQPDRTESPAEEGQRATALKKEASWLGEEHKRSRSAEGRDTTNDGSVLDTTSWTEEGSDSSTSSSTSNGTFGLLPGAIESAVIAEPTHPLLLSLVRQVDQPIPSPAQPVIPWAQQLREQEARAQAARAAAPPSISLMIDIGEQVPAQMQIRWTEYELRVQQQEVSSSPPPSYRFHQYVLRVSGVRSERHMALLSAGPLAVDCIPPLHIYPHGIRQHRVCIRDCGLVQLSHEQLTLAERFHLHAFGLLKERDQLAPHAPPFPRPPEPGCWSAAACAASSKQYLLLPCHPKSSVEQSLADLEGWLHLDEHDAHHMSDAEVQQELEWQKQLRDSLSEGMPVGSSYRPAAASDDYIECEDAAAAAEGSTSALPPASTHSSTMLDFEFMHSVLDATSAAPASVATVAASRPSDPLDSRPPRTLLLYTPYSGRFYSNLSLPVTDTALSPFPKRDAYANYKEYYEQKWRINVLHPEASLIAAANFSTAPINVLQPLMLSLKKRQAKEPVMLLLPDATQALETMPAQMLHLLRMMPCILHRLEVNLLHAELALELGLELGSQQAQLRPYCLRQSLTSGNAQEAFPLPLAISEGFPAPSATAARSGSAGPLSRSIGSATAFAASVAPAASAAPPPPPPPPAPLVFSYDRLKFVGDSVLKLVLTKLLLGDYAHEAEEGITRRKGSMLNMRAMAKHALDKGLQRFVCAHPFQLTAFKPPGTTAGNKSASRKASIGEGVATEEGSDAASSEGEGASSSSAAAASGHFSLFSASPTSSFPAAGATLFPADSSGSSSSSNASLSSIHSQVSQHVLADLVSSLVGAAWQSNREQGALQMLVALGLLPVRSALSIGHRLERFSVMADTKLDSFVGQSRLQTLLASQGECERVIGYSFHSRALYAQAFSHERWSGGSAAGGGGSVSSSSAIAESSVTATPSAAHRLPSYERLELLGDAVLELCVSSFLTVNFPRASSSGDLTFLRQRLVSNQVLASHMRASDLQPFVEPLPSAGHFASTALAAPAPKLLADVLEALLGAVYVDSGYRFAPVWAAYLRIVSIREIDTVKLKIRTKCS